MKEAIDRRALPERGKYQELKICADGSERAHQPFSGWSELWIFTGTRCNLTCAGCYTESSPKNDSFRFLTREQAEKILLEARDLGIPRINFTGGEPFYNPEFPAILERTLALGFECLVLTNLTRPFESKGRDLAHQRIRAGYPLYFRASLDHPDPIIHEQGELGPGKIRDYPVAGSPPQGRKFWFFSGFNRGPGSFRKTLRNLGELFHMGGRISVAGRGPQGIGGDLFQAYLAETEPKFRELFRENRLPADLPLKIFPDIGGRSERDVPEITQHRCRTLISPGTFDGLMCNQVRMVAVPAVWNGRENHTPMVYPCTIVPDNPAMVLGTSLQEAAERETYLADPRCYRFCITGGASCSKD